MDVRAHGNQLRNSALGDVAAAHDEDAASGKTKAGRVRGKVAHGSILPPRPYPSVTWGQFPD